MKLFIYLLMQILIFMPIASLAAEGNLNFLVQNQKTEVTEAQKPGIIKTYGKLPLYFIENKGQVNMQVSFYERGTGHATFFTSDGVVLSLSKSDENVENPFHTVDIQGLDSRKNKKITTEAVRLSFVGANKNAKIIADEKMPGHVNYFVGNDKTKWRSNVPTYGAVIYKDVYKNIDVKFYGNNKNIEHDVIVHPGGDFSLVKFAYEGVKGLKVNESGDLEVSLKDGKIIEQKPIIYQNIKGQRVSVEGTYRILKGEKGNFTYGFNVASYDHTKDLVIDPVLVYSTYLGGSAVDVGQDIAVDASGAVYVAGYTSSLDFPLVTPQAIYGGGSYDVFITKINPSGSAMVYSTYLGGSGTEGYSDIWNSYNTSIAVDSSGAVFVTGGTDSMDFPLMNPIQSVCGDGITCQSNAFITKLNPTGSALVYSTYLGGTSWGDYATDIAVDGTGAAFVTGVTSSSDFPLMNPIQAICGDGMYCYGAAFVTKINPAGSALVYSTYLGGTTDMTYGEGIALDASGNAYVVGRTSSLDFPLLNPIQGVLGGGYYDAFVTEINPAGTTFVYSTYLGGSDYEYNSSIAVDASGNAYITGRTQSLDFPVASAIQGRKAGPKGQADLFVTKINAIGTALIYSTYLGGSDYEGHGSIAVDASGNAYISGYTASTDFPLVSALPWMQTGNGDAFITKINSAGSAIAYSTLLGGTLYDEAFGVAVDASGNAYVTGTTYSSDFPLASPMQGASAGILDAFIAKINGASAVTITITPDAVSFARGSTLGYNVTATNTTPTSQCFDYWENVTLPNGPIYPTTGALFGPVNLCLNAGASKSAHLTHGLPMSAPVGAYVFNTFVGTYPSPLTSETHFNFNVTAFNPATKKPQRSWRLLENGFRN